VERWRGLEATAYLYIAFVAVPSVLAAVHAARPQAHQCTHDGRSATSAAGVCTTRATSRPPQPPHTDERS
jgi:tRNA (Thr-GGU) A37 N-methylase